MLFAPSDGLRFTSVSEFGGKSRTGYWDPNLNNAGWDERASIPRSNSEIAPNPTASPRRSSSASSAL